VIDNVQNHPICDGKGTTGIYIHIIGRTLINTSNVKQDTTT